MKTGMFAIFVTVMLSASAAQAERLKISNATLTLLRVHEVDSRYGRTVDQIDVEVVIKLAGRDGAFGFQLRDDQNRLVRQGMLDLLRDAFNNDWLVNIVYDIPSANDIVTPRNGVILRVWLTKPSKVNSIVEAVIE